MTRKTFALATAVMATALIAGPSANAQRVKRLNVGPGYQIPGTGLRMWPPPRYQYQIGGQRIYTNRNLNRGWYSNSGYWPYGYPQNYRWPYGNSVKVRRGWR